MENIALSVKNLTKVYSLYNKPIDRLKEAIFSFKSYHKDFYALDDINFEIKQGDRVGIIGKNGAGKSTLLKVISKVTAPTKGRIGIRGNVASLLEVGTGFHPEMTGRENIYLNGAILGMKRAEINDKIDEIIAFSEIDEHIDNYHKL